MSANITPNQAQQRGRERKSLALRDSRRIVEISINRAGDYLVSMHEAHGGLLASCSSRERPEISQSSLYVRGTFYSLSHEECAVAAAWLDGIAGEQQ
jgi:hypothetical protein